ncbi:MAG TPA: AAA family ATPase [Gemmatimonadales bacterium]|nr:AAA family ATPase [Gemmatimonadales bacterium]
MTAPHTLCCLGRPALIGPDGRAVRFRTRKHLALLVYLAVESRAAHRRDRLVDLLWPNASHGEGRHSLSTALSVLRAKLGRPAIKSSRDNVQLVMTDLELDLHRLADSQLLETDLMPALEVGGFLEDFDIPGATAFAHWRDQQRATWLPHIQAALRFLIDRCRRTGDFTQIERYADRLLALDDLNEEGMRAKMEARAFAGDRLTALRLFEEWKGKLHAELDAAPSPLIEGMALRLRRRGWERANTKEIAPVPTDQWKGRRFIGRTQEYGALYTAWESTVGGSPRHAFVVGDSGVGKSTLVERLATAAGLSGGVSSRVQCYELEHEIPYAALSNLLHGLIVLPGASATSPEALAELSRSAPRVREHFHSIPTPQNSQGENSRIRLTDAVQQLVCSVAEEQPVMLVVDDFHLADDASISVIHLLMRRIETDRVMVLLTARTGELGRSPNASRLREAQSRLNMTTIELPPLSGEESAALVESLMEPGESPPKGPVLQALIRAGAGFPMALELLVKDWRINGERSLALSLEAMTEEPLAQYAPSDAYRRLLDRLTMGLDPTTRNVLNLAAVLGPRLNDLEMYALMDLSLGQTMSAMSELARIRILRDGTHGLEFVNELIRAQTYLTIPSPLRRTIHGRIVDRLLELGDCAAEAAGLEIAWHCVRAGRVTEATPYLLQGAKSAMRRGAPYEAERALASALDRLEEPERSEAVILLAKALMEQGKLKGSLSLLERSQPLASTNQNDFAQILSIHHRLRTVARTREDEAMDRSTLITIARGSKVDSTRALGVTTACRVLPDNETPTLNDQLLGIMSQINPDNLDLETRGALALARGRILYRKYKLKEARSEIECAVNSLSTQGMESSIVASLYVASAILAIADGEYTSALCQLNSAWRISVRLGNDFISSSVAGNLAVCHCRMGNFGDQIEWGKRAVGYARITHVPQHVMLHTSILALGYALTEDSSKAAQILETTDSLLARTQDRAVYQSWCLYSADSLLVMGRTEEATEKARGAGVGTPAEFSIATIVGKYARWTALEGASGDHDLAARTLDHLMTKRMCYDRLDQVEVINAKSWFDSKLGRNYKDNFMQFERELEAMPPGVSILLRRLGMMDFSD